MMIGEKNFGHTVMPKYKFLMICLAVSIEKCNLAAENYIEKCSFGRKKLLKSVDSHACDASQSI